jgi:methyltransferase
MDSRIAFTMFVSLVAAQRLWELHRSARNEARLREMGGVEHAPEQMKWMRALHASWLVAMLLEVWLLDAPFIPALAVVAMIVFGIGQGLRIAAIHELGFRWTVKIMTVPGEDAISSGLFKYIRHPNYVGVVLEIAALPLIHGAFITSFMWTVANAILLRARIRAEEAALRANSHYEQNLGSRPRFLPRLSAPGPSS